MANNLSLISNEQIVVQERSIQVTDEKLTRLLLNTYEQARVDAHEFKLYNHYSVFFSIAGSLFITLLTSTFHDFSVFSSKTLTYMAWGVFVISLFVGISLAIVRASQQRNDEHTERDQAVEKILANLLCNEYN